MGLDVYALQIVGPGEADSDYLLKNVKDFEARGDGIAHGWYECKKIAPSAGTIHWSYGGYSWWREQLARFAHPDLHIPEGGTGYAKTHPYSTAIWANPAMTGAFVELISFSDCEGFIGPKTCAKLYRDFKAYETSFLDTHDDHYDCGRPYLAVMEALKAIVDSPSPAVLRFG